MGLFKKDSPAEKKLKELTGGFMLSSSFINLLKSHNLNTKDGIKIQNQLKDEIKQGKVNENNLESRLNQLINVKSGHSSNNTKQCPECNKKQDSSNIYCTNCGHEFKSKIECPICHEKQDPSNIYCTKCGYDFRTKKSREVEKSVKKVPEVKITQNPELDEFKRKTQFLNQYDFNLKTCPECDTLFLKQDPFCFNCGASVATSDTIRNENLKVEDGKLVSNNEPKADDELSDLELLYSNTVQSKYSPDFKYVYVLFLDAFRKNPTKEFAEKTAKQYETTVKKLKSQAIEDEFIEIASPLLEARKSKVSDLKDILKEHGLKVSGKKDELIERLGENLSEDELKKYFKAENYQISSKGEEFLDKNSYIFYIRSDKDISRVFQPHVLGKIFEDNHYSQDEIYEKLLEYLKKTLDERLTHEAWIDFKLYSNAIAQVQEDKGDLKEALNNRFKVFLFDINNYTPVLDKPDPRGTKLKQKDVAKLNQLLHELSLPIDEVKDLFETAFDEVLFKTVIPKKDSLIYLLKIFGGADLDAISQEINEIYSTPY